MLAQKLNKEIGDICGRGTAHTRRSTEIILGLFELNGVTCTSTISTSVMNRTFYIHSIINPTKTHLYPLYWHVNHSVPECGTINSFIHKLLFLKLTKILIDVHYFCTEGLIPFHGSFYLLDFLTPKISK